SAPFNDGLCDEPIRRFQGCSARIFLGMTRLPVGQDKGVFDDFDSEPGPSMSHVGSAAVVDLEAVCDHYGVSDLPSPLGRSRPVGSMWLLTRDLPPIDYRLE